MVAVSLALLLLAQPPATVVETSFVQTAPVPRDIRPIIPSPGQRRAVVLIQGLYMGPAETGGSTAACCILAEAW